MNVQMSVTSISIFVILISYLILSKCVFYPGSDNVSTILSQVSHRKNRFASGSTDDFSICPGDQG